MWTWEDGPYGGILAPANFALIKIKAQQQAHCQIIYYYSTASTAHGNQTNKNAMISERALTPHDWHATHHRRWHQKSHNRCGHRTGRANNVDTHARLRKGQQRDGRRIADPLAAKRSGLSTAIGSDRSGRIAQRTWKKSRRALDQPIVGCETRATGRLWYVRVLRVAKVKSHICDYDNGSDGDCQSLSWSSWTLTWLIFGSNMWCERMGFKQSSSYYSTLFWY